MIALRMALGALVGLGVGACFTAPSGPVLFSCEHGGRSACPPGYACLEDDCCHADADASPDDESWNACKLSPSGDGTAGSDTGTTAGSDTAGSDTGSDTGSGTGSGSGSETDADTDAGPGTSSGTAGEETTAAPGDSSSDGATGSTTGG